VVYEGEHALVKDKHQLGKFDLSGIPPAPRGVPQIDVTFEIDENSILTVTAHEKGTKQKKTISITNDQGRLIKEEIEKMVADAEKFAESDKVLRDKIDAKFLAWYYLYQMRNTVEDKEKLANKIDEDDKEKILDALQEAQEWLNSNEDADKEDLESHLKELQSICDPIIATVYKD